MPKRKKDGLQRLFDFIAYLKKEKIEFSIHNRSHDSLSLDFAGVGIRYEVDFYVDEMNFSYAKTDESVFTDETELKKIIKDHWGD